MRPPETRVPGIVYVLQLVSLSLMWIFVSGITWWILRLIRVSVKLKDAPDASVAISIVVIPVFITLASVLTYVFVGLQQHRDSREDKT